MPKNAKKQISSENFKFSGRLSAIAQKKPYIPNVPSLPEGVEIRPWNENLRTIRSNYGDSSLDAVLNFVAGDNGAVIGKKTEPLYNNDPNTLVIDGKKMNRKQVVKDFILPVDPGRDVDSESEEGYRKTSVGDIPDFEGINKMVRAYSDSMGPEKPPKYVAAYGEPNSAYNISGMFMPSSPERLNIQAKSVKALLDQEGETYGKSAGTLAHELAHAYQWQRRTPGSVPRKWFAADKLPQVLAMREQGRGSVESLGTNFKGEPFLGKPREIEASLIGNWVQDVIEAVQEDKYRTERAPNVKPR